MKKIFLSLLTIFMVLSLSVALVKANETTTVAIADGVQIRTDGNNGLKWVANVTNHKEGNEYGFLFAQGDLAEVTIDTANVVNKAVEGVTLEEPVMSATMVKFPKNAATQDISVVAYVNDGENYSYSKVVVRNLAEVAISAKNSIDGSFVNSVANYVGENYKKTFTDAQGSLYFDNALYETNHKVLASEFINDWNTLFSTELVAESAFTGGSNSTWYKSAKTSSQTSWENSKLKEFFQDEAMYAKWGWLLNYIASELSAGTGHDFAVSQANAIINNVEDTANWYYSGHLCSFIMSTMCGDYASSGWGSFSFSKHPTVLGLIGNYNNTIYTKNQNCSFVNISGEIALPEIEHKAGYSSNWIIGENSYVGNDNYVLEAETNYLFVRKYTPITYSVKFYNGEEELTALSTTYNVENEVTLPTLELDGYNFLGWYTDSSLSGDPVTTIATGTTGDKVYYAKVEEEVYANVNVTFDTNGGYFPLEYSSNIQEFATYSNSGLASGIYFCDTGVLSNNSLRWQYKVLLQFEESSNAYKVVAVDAAKASANNAASAAGVTWTHAISSSSSNIATQYTVGYYIIFLKTPTLGDSNLKYVVTSDPNNAYPTSYSMTLSEPTTLIVPSHKSYTFVGWKSSVDGSTVTEFPGYLTNPGDITYTAQWVKTFNVSLSLDGGNLLYSTYEELIADYTADYKTLTGQGSFSVWKGTVNKLGDMFRNSNKWDWLLDYWAAVNTNSYNGTTNASVFAKMKENGTCSDYYFFSVEMTAFGTSTSTSVYSGGLKSADYTQEAVRNLAWTYLSQSHETTTEYTSEYVLPTIAYKAGYTFAGWYTTADFQEGTQVTSVSDDCTVYAKWVAVAE